MNKIIEKYPKKIKKPGGTIYIHYSILEEYINELIKENKEILGYDGLIINNTGTESPIDLIFDFSRNKKSCVQEKNDLAIKNIKTLLETVKNNEYNLDDLYIDVVYK